MPLNPNVFVPGLPRRSDRIRWARENQLPPMSQRELARRVGVSPRTIQMMETEQSGTTRSRYADKVASALEVAFKWVMDEQGSPFEREDTGDIRWLPVLETPQPMIMSHRKPIAVWMLDALSDDSFLFQVRDDAMAPAIPKGAWVVCDPQARPEPGKVVLVSAPDLNNGQPTLRRWCERDIAEELVPDNVEYVSLNTDRDTLIVMGVLVGTAFSLDC